MANRYFLNIGSNWNDSANWSTTSGGAGGSAVPTSSDDVFFDANSGDCAVDISADCRDLTFTGFTGTFAGSQALDVFGSLTLATGMTLTYTGAITFKATATGKTITLDGKTTNSTIAFSGSGGGWTVQDAWNNSAKNFSLTNGTWNTNGQTITTTGGFSGTSGSTRTLTLGASTFNCASFAAGSGMTLTANTATIALTGTTSSVFSGAGKTYSTVTITSTSTSTIFIDGANTFTTLTITGPANKTQIVSLTANQTVSGTLTIAGNSLTNRLLIQSDTLGTARTITAATTTISNCDFMDITGAGAGSWSGTSIGNALGDSGITFTTPVTRYAVVAGNWSDTATWSSSSGGAGGSSVPLCHDTVILNASSAAGTYVADIPRLGADITCTGFTRTLTLTSTSNTVYSSLTLASGMTFTQTQYLIFRGRSSHTLTTGSKTFDYDLYFYALGGTYTLQDDLVSTSSAIVFNGTFDANDNDISVTYWYSYPGVVALYMGSGTWTLSGPGFSGSTTVWDFLGTTLHCETSTLVINNTTASNRTLAGNGKTYNIVRLAGAGAGSNTISGSNTIATFESTKTNAYSILFTTGTTQTIANWNVVGSSGNVVTINSTTTGTHALVKTGAEVRSDYLNIQHSVASPSNIWYAGVNSTDNQAVATSGSGWLFTVPLPTCTTQAVSGISDLSATGNGNGTDDGSGIISERGSVYDTVSRSDPGNLAPASTLYTFNTIDTGTFSEGAFTNSLTGLTELTTYYVRAYCKNQAGYDYGTEVSFVTLESPPAPVVSTQAASSTTSTTATGNGTVVDSDGTVTERGFVYDTVSRDNPGDTTPASTDYASNAGDTGTFGEGAFTKGLTGLTANSTYYIRAYAENGSGFGYGDEVTFTTDRLSTVTLQNPTNRQSETATLNGTVTDAGGDTIIKQGFVWDTATQTAPGNVAPASSGYDFTQSEIVSTIEGAFDEAITGLSPNTTYYMRAFAQNSLGYSYSDESQFSTLAFPNTTTMVNVDTQGATLTNTETQAGSGIINQSTTSTVVTNLNL